MSAHTSTPVTETDLHLLFIFSREKGYFHPPQTSKVMSFQIQSVFISDDIDSVCPRILEENGIQVSQKSKLTAEQLIAELQVRATVM